MPRARHMGPSHRGQPVQPPTPCYLFFHLVITKESQTRLFLRQEGLRAEVESHPETTF